MPGVTGSQKRKPLQIGKRRRRVVMIGRIVAVQMAGMSFPRPAVEMAVAMIVGRGGGVTLDLGKGQGGRIMRTRMTEG